MVYEAMQRLRFEAFLESLDHDEKEGLELAVLDMIESFPDQEFVDWLEKPEMEAISESYETFIQELSKRSKTFAFWSMYIRMTGKFVYKMKILARKYRNDEGC